MNLHRLDLVSLSLFHRVARSGSISRAAALSHLAVGAASKRISDLETALGTPLLQRHSRGVTLTAAGQALMVHAQRILHDVDDLAAELSDHAAGFVGRVRLWANTSAVTQFLPADVAAFVAANPGIRIELEERDSSAIVLAVLDGRADVGLFADGTPPLGLATRVYRRDRLALVVPRGHALARRKAVALAEAAEFDFVSLPDGTSLAQRLAQAVEGQGRRLRVRIQVRSFDAMCHMVAAGLGVAVLPVAAAQPHLQSMKLARVDIREPWAERALLLGVRDPDTLARPARAWVDHVMATAPA